MKPLNIGNKFILTHEIATASGRRDKRAPPVALAQAVERLALMKIGREAERHARRELVVRATLPERKLDRIVRTFKENVRTREKIVPERRKPRRTDRKRRAEIRFDARANFVRYD